AAHVLRKTAADAATLHAAGVISRQVQQMTRIIEDLLDVTRVTRGKVSLSRRPLELGAAAQSAVRELRASRPLPHHGIELQLGEAWVRADEARLEQIICSLVGNAVKYTPPGGRITLSVHRDKDTAVLRVRDNGIGMTPALAGRVFDLFVQGEDRGSAG